MTRKIPGLRHSFLFLLILFLAVQPYAAMASADYELLLRDIPGQWTYTGYVEDPQAENGLREADRASITFDEAGNVTLSCYDADGGYMYAFNGTWTLEEVPDLNDRMTIRYTATDDPAWAESGYSAECVYEVYMESWVENDTRTTYFICTPVNADGADPFAETYGEWEMSVHREQGPNMRVIKCKDYASLREKRSKSAKRLAKVPLGALVLANPEAGDENGFIQCIYHGTEGYILAEYLESVQ